MPSLDNKTQNNNVVDVQSFAMNFGHKEVIKDLSFNVKQGEVFGFLGLMEPARQPLYAHYLAYTNQLVAHCT